MQCLTVIHKYTLSVYQVLREVETKEKGRKRERQRNGRKQEKKRNIYACHNCIMFCFPPNNDHFPRLWSEQQTDEQFACTRLNTNR